MSREKEREKKNTYKRDQRIRHKQKSGEPNDAYVCGHMAHWEVIQATSKGNKDVFLFIRQVFSSWGHVFPLTHVQCPGFCFNLISVRTHK